MNKKAAVTKFVVFILLIPALTACQAAVGRNDNMPLGTAGDDYNQTVGESLGIGALAGAAIGAAIGSMLGGTSGAIAGTGIGVVSGALVGGVGGTAIAGQKQDFVNREDELDRAIEYARATNDQIASVTLIVDRIVEERRTELMNIQAKPAADVEAQRRNMVRLSSQLTGEIASLNKALSSAHKARDTIQRNVDNLGGSQSATVLVEEASTTDQQISVLEDRKHELIALRGRL